eukprot:CAMPEP_0177763516 /NCGR_PEP_ID=MMETSP0491_2-20121128/6914_1 /TAXON_ID=63592 /ORGANISM="Tetraselmis chuii, Strain PLY429" /LENGTH=248 /DNA_ID=CAMNT_0019279631 /DNA_START=144 /DNA_END=890 /DNA_ORIENTATION=-
MAQLYTSIDGKQYHSADGVLTSARVRLHNASNWLRNHDFHRGTLVGLAIGLVVAFMIAGIDKQGLIIRDTELENKLMEERDALRTALKKAVEKVREAEERASRAIEHANQQMHATAQRAIDMQGEVNQHIQRVHEARADSSKHQQVAMQHQQAAAQHLSKLQETSQHLEVAHEQLKQVDSAEQAWEKFHRTAIENTVRHGDHKAFPNMVLNADQAASTGWRVGQKQAVNLYGGGKDKSGRGRRLRGGA